MASVAPCVGDRGLLSSDVVDVDIDCPICTVDCSLERETPVTDRT